MPFCPECGAEYRKGFEECADCGAELVEEEEDELLPDDEDDDLEDEEEEDEELEQDDGDLIEIYSGPPYAANLVVNALKEHGIGATSKPDGDNTLIAPAEVSVYVTETDYNLRDDIIHECLELVEVEEDQGEAFGR